MFKCANINLFLMLWGTIFLASLIAIKVLVHINKELVNFNNEWKNIGMDISNELALNVVRIMYIV